MAPKFGNVLYVLACLLAVLILALGATVFFLADPSSKAGQNPIAVLGASVVAAILIWGIGEGLRYILAGTSTRLKREQLEERLAALEQRIDAVDTRLTRYEETVGPQLILVSATAGGVRDVEPMKEQALRSLASRW